MLVTTLVISHIDYCNAVLFGLPDCLIKKLQRVQNCAAKLVLQRNRFDAAAALRELHWLPVKNRIRYKIALTVFKCLHDLAPEYLQNLLCVKSHARNLRSASVDAVFLEVPVCSRKTFLDRSFAVSGPSVWNKLPADLRSINNIANFKSSLKTFYCNQVFNI